MSEYLRLFEAELAEQRVRIFRGDDPALGAELSVVVPAGSLWQLYTVHATLTSDATVANRVVHLAIDDGSTVFYRWHSNANHTASLSPFYLWSVGVVTLGNVSIGFAAPLPNPPLLLRPGCRIRTLTGGLQAGDNWSAPALYVLETVMRGPLAQAQYEERLRRRAERVRGELGLEPTT